MKFSQEKYKNIALSSQLDETKVHHPTDAFLLLINGLKKNELNNLSAIIANKLEITEDEAYELTQNFKITQDAKNTILESAYECIKKKPLGTKIVDDHSTTRWVNHCLNVGEVCATLASKININTDTARTLGILHDYGRKFSQEFKHTILGYEALTELGWKDEAISCLTHSFINENRNASCEKSLPGFALDDSGNPYWLPNSEKDDITFFLEQYHYTEYDHLLNIADLTATANEITKLHIRLEDILSRREIDKKSMPFFLAEATNLLLNYLQKAGFIQNHKIYKADKKTTEEELKNRLIQVSDIFYTAYKIIETENKE